MKKYSWKIPPHHRHYVEGERPLESGLVYDSIMSRATWYRHGKPVTKPQRMTQARLAARLETSVRTIQRAARIEREAPTLIPAIASGELSVGAAEKLL